MKLNKSITIFFLLACLGISAYSQSNSAQKTNQCRYGEAGFVGESIDLSVVDVDIREVTMYITQQFNCDFVIDDSVKEGPITTTLTNVPWNLALEAILQSQGLHIQLVKTDSCNKLLRVSDKVADADYGICKSPKLDKMPLYTEFILLKNVSDESRKTHFEDLKITVSKRLSRRGAIEFDDKSNTLIVTDTKENVEAVKQLIAYLEILDGETIET